MKFIKVREVKSPTRGTKESAGIDFYVPDENGVLCIEPGESVCMPSGIKVILPKGYSGNFYNKSGVGKKGLLVGAQVVDSDYRGEVHLNVHNVTNFPVEIQPGQKLVQMLVQKVELCDIVEITESDYQKEASTERATGGFGSTGE